MTDPILLGLSICTLSIVLFSVNLLLLRIEQRPTYLPLVTCLLSVGTLSSLPIAAEYSRTMYTVLLILSLPAMMLISPSFWFYTKGITAEKKWHWRQESTRHYWPFNLALFVALLAFLMPSELRTAILIEGNEAKLESAPTFLRYLVYALLTTTFLLILAWVGQSGFYFFKILYHLQRYRKRLKDLFASTDNREIGWLSWLLAAIGIVWLITATHLVLDNLFFTNELNAVFYQAVVLLMVWSIALWGLRQKPGFEELYTAEEPANTSIEVNAVEPPAEKYQRSALDETMATGIAKKIEHAMTQDKLYLDPAISLPKLAKHIHTSQNYISQTLNETLGLSFFDLINQHRVNQAKQMLIHSDKTVLDIAMQVGFNAKSSFYTAFKKETNQTPSQFRKQTSKPN